MNIFKFIKTHPVLNQLPFIVVFSVVNALSKMNLLEHFEVKKDGVD